MKLAFYFLISVAFHAAVLTFPIAVFETSREQLFPVVLLLETGEIAAQAPRSSKVQNEKKRGAKKIYRKLQMKNPAEAVMEVPGSDKEKTMKEAVSQNIFPPLMEKVAPERPIAAKAALPDIKKVPASSQIEPEEMAKSGEQIEEKVSEPPVAAREEKEVSITPTRVSFAGPGYAYNPKPRYPEEARSKGWEGTVVLRVLIGPVGNPEDIEVSRSSGFEALDQAAVQSVKRWRFHPARYGDRRIESWAKIPIMFRLDER